MSLRNKLTNSRILKAKHVSFASNLCISHTSFSTAIIHSVCYACSTPLNRQSLSIFAAPCVRWRWIFMISKLSWQKRSSLKFVIGRWASLWGKVRNFIVALVLIASKSSKFHNQRLMEAFNASCVESGIATNASVSTKVIAVRNKLMLQP